MEPAFDLPMTLPRAEGAPLLRTLHAQLRTAILDGRLGAGARMPSTRALATQYGVSRNTALAAYDLLLSEGYLVSQPRGGTYVAQALPALQPRSLKQSAPAGEERINAFWRAPPPLEGHPARPVAPVCDFRFGAPDESELRLDIWQRLAARSMRAWGRGPGRTVTAQGQPLLREAIAGHVAFTRAVACRAADLVVTGGTQQALDLLARILVTPGKTVVAVEDPGYPPMRAVFAAAGARIVPVPVDEEGLMVELLPEVATIVYVTPSHQFPLGCAMSMRRRIALLEFARRRNAVILEDDYDGEFRFSPRPLDALQTLDQGECVFYLGTFSKSLFPALRMGFVVAPQWAHAALCAAKQCSDWHSAVPLQDTLAAFIMEGHLARHVRKMRQIYGERRQHLLALIERDFDGVLKPIEGSAGLYFAALSAPSLDLEELTRAALAEGVGIYTLRPYYMAGLGRPGLGFGYGCTSMESISEGMARLARLVRRQS